MTYMGGIEWSQREGSNLRPADYEGTALVIQLADNYDIRWAAKSSVLRLCSSETLSLLPGRNEALEFFKPVLDEDHFGDRMSARA
jgi:hypothetical protein